MIQDKQLFALVRRIAWSFARRTPSQVSLDDLMGPGGIGLAEALQKRHLMSDDEFLLFAAARIRGAILDELRRLDPLPRYTRRAAKQLEAAVTRSGEGSEEAAAVKLGISARTLAAIQSTRSSYAAPSVSAFPAANDNSPETLFADKECVERMKEMANELSPRMREVMQGKYEGDETQSEIARRLGLTEARICQLHTSAVRKIAERFACESKVA
jgi:RNA polymerase sigma factor for flagellar operon FliA